MFSKLFSPLKIKSMELKNRIIFPSMGTKFVGKENYVTQRLIDYHVARTKGGCSLNMVEVSGVHSPSTPKGFLSISEDKYIPGLKQLTDAIHAEGGKAGAQLWQGSIAVAIDQTAQIFMASDMQFTPQIMLPGIKKEQIPEIIQCYAQAAKRAAAAGFDCIEFHCAHTYLPHSFLSGGINHRTDEYGGSFENRAKFPLECIRAIRGQIPEDMPILMRIPAHDDYLEGGLTIEEIIEFCKLAKDAGVDVLDVSRGNVLSAGLKYEVPSIDIPNAFNIDNAARIRRETGMPTIGVGRINTAELAEQILEEDKADLVVMGRAQLVDPDFCKKAKAGNTEDIDYCVGCNQGCYDGFENVNSERITCLRNPALGRETECALTMAEDPKTVLIAGAGIAGLEAAIILKKRNHNPILCEASGVLGGQFLMAGTIPGKFERKKAMISMCEKAKRLGVDIRMNTKVTPEMIDEIHPHTVINAAGAEPIMPSVPGSEKEFVVSFHDVLNGKVNAAGNIVVVGGGLFGVETAQYMAEKGANVTILEPQKELCADMGSIRKICMTESIYAAGINPVTKVKVTEIKDHIIVGKQGGKTVEFPCDYVIWAVGTKKRDGSKLQKACYDRHIGYYEVGDASMPRRALNAVREAFDAALVFDREDEHEYASNPKKTIFLTGATGTMGQETLKQLLSRNNRFQVRALVLPLDKDKEIIKKYACPSLEVIWGDMADYDTIKKGVDGADYVLHIGAMVSPAADEYPEKTLYTNIGSTLNIIKAIKEQPDPDKVHFVYIGTIALTGGRTEPIHWGRVGDPINPSIFDYYALSKVYSELAVFDSGLKHWVSIRQSGMHPVAEGAGDQPITFHQPPNNVLEWSTSIESGICMANICENWVPESFWRKGYNLSSGAGYRLTNWEIMDISLGAFGIGLKDLYDANMLAQYNFHGHFFSDSDKLNDILHFRCIPAEHYWGGVREEMNRMAANPMIRAMFPTGEQMKAKNIETGRKRMGTYWMFENNEENWIKAFFGSREKQKAIKNWDEYDLHHPSKEVTYLNHGYDEAKPLKELTLEDLKKAAKFRGGECLAEEIPDIYTPIKWSCADGHEFFMSVNAVLHGGHWCPKCLSHEWKYGQIAKKNPFYAQVWTPLHGEGDDYVIPMEYSGYDIAEELKEKLGL